MVHESVKPTTLKSRTLDGLAEYLKSGKVKNVVVMSGAGISTSAGIPDFRSPETGLYANLARLNLPYAEAVFDISYFRQNPLPFYTLAQELYPGRYRPTITHSFIRLLHDKGLLLKHFTQNIDCLDREAGVPGDKIVEAHGSFASQGCIDCGQEFPDDEMLDFVNRKKVPHCKECHGLVKPRIVFFGEALPAEFFASRGLPARADLIIVLGTSLTVQPFASLPGLVPDNVPRVLINLERVGSLGSRPDDLLLLGDCDDGVRKIAKAWGCLDDLEELWAATAAKSAADIAKDVNAEDEIDKLTKDIDQTLKINKDHAEKLKQEAGMKTDVARHIDGQTAAGSEDGPAEIKAPQKQRNLSHVFPHIKPRV